MDFGVENMVFLPECSIARIRRKDGTIAGGGFLVDHKIVLTCAHVVSKILAASEGPRKEGSYLDIDFPLINPGKILKAHVVFWSSEDEADIAGLELDDKLPEGAKGLGMIAYDDLSGHRFRTFGFPAGIDIGVWAYGILRDRNAKGWVQIEDEKVTGNRVEQGFSGSPVLDVDTGAAVGMVVASENRPEAKVAFIIPTNALIETWPKLGGAVINHNIEKFNLETDLIGKIDQDRLSSLLIQLEIQMSNLDCYEEDMAKFGGQLIPPILRSSISDTKKEIARIETEIAKLRKNKINI